MISAGVARLHELQTIYGTEDLHDLLEVVNVDSYNRALASEPEED